MSPYSGIPQCDQALHRQRLNAARPAGEDGELRDPIEDDPALRAVFQEADRLAEARLRESRIAGMGACLAFSAYKQKILRDEFGIVWFTPAQMNPETLYD